MPAFTNKRRARTWWMVLLLLPFAGALCAPFFDRSDPAIWGAPPFVWYLLLWIIVSALVTRVVYSKITASLEPSWQRRRK